MQIPTETLNELIQSGQKIARRQWVPATSGNFSIQLPDQAIWITASGLDKGALTQDDFLVVNDNGEPAPNFNRKPSAETLLHTQIYKKQPGTRCILHTHSPSSVLLSKMIAPSPIPTASVKPRPKLDPIESKKTENGKRGLIRKLFGKSKGNRLKPYGRWTSFEFNDYEVVKAFPGIESHFGPYRIPVFANRQEIPCLADIIEPFFSHLTDQNLLNAAHNRKKGSRKTQAQSHPIYLPAYLLRGHGIYTWAATIKQAFIQLEALEAIMSCDIKLRLGAC